MSRTRPVARAKAPAKKRRPRVAELLIEIGLEEIPASWLSGLAGQLKTQLETIAGRELLEPAQIRVAWAPRRLTLGAEVVAKQKDREESVLGPPAKAAKNPAGEWTPAARGFAKKNGCRPEDLGEGHKEGSPEPYLLFVKKTAGRASVDVLPGVLAATLRSLAFPKRMNWDAWLEDGKGAFPFGRPIRWLIALLDTTVVPFVIYELAAGAKGKARVA